MTKSLEFTDLQNIRGVDLFVRPAGPEFAGRLSANTNIANTHKYRNRFVRMCTHTSWNCRAFSEITQNVANFVEKQWCLVVAKCSSRSGSAVLKRKYLHKPVQGNYLEKNTKQNVEFICNKCILNLKVLQRNFSIISNLS